MEPQTRPVVTLTESEMILAGSVAIQRYAQNLARSKPEMYGAEDRYGFQYMIDGAFGECAIAKFKNLYWNGSVGNLLAKDVGTVQVRATRMEPPALILHDKDPDDDIFVLVKLLANTARICGWLYGKEGKRDAFWSVGKGGNRPAFFVPVENLRQVKS